MIFKTASDSIYEFADGRIRLVRSPHPPADEGLVEGLPATMVLFGKGIRGIFRTDLGPLKTNIVTDILDPCTGP